MATPIVLLHAFPVDARMWSPVKERLAERTRVITPDQRGLGRTPLPDTDRQPNLEDAAADVIAMLDRLEIDRVVLGGSSMGGYVAMAVMRAAPERVAGLVLIDTKAGPDGAEARANRLATADRVESEGQTGWLADSMIPGLLGRTTQAESPAVAERLRELIEAQPSAGIAWAQRAMAARPDSFATLRDANVAALVVVGEEDQLSPVDDARDMVEALPRAELATIARSGHLPPLENPDAVSEAILEWLP